MQAPSPRAGPPGPPSPPAPGEDITGALRRHFGLSGFRDGQEEIVRAVLAGTNSVVVMPTGAGKSLCYQLPATLLPGLTLVVSPLIALMEDQVTQLTARGVSATYLNSTLTPSEQAERLRGIQRGAFRLLYVAPERLRAGGLLELLARVGVALLAIDEAHCISQWGHDFRPDYALLGKVRRRLRPPRTVAVTATATPEVREDIARILLMKEPRQFVSGFDRPNLFLGAKEVANEGARRAEVLSMAGTGERGIVYCATRRAAEGLHRALRDAGHRPALYHGGLDEALRHRAQSDFMEGQSKVVVATNAFGMGIDKADLRFVVHAQLPRAVEAYYQEIGRAGRDGAPARALLLFNPSDVHTQQHLIRTNVPDVDLLERLWTRLQDGAASARILSRELEAPERELQAALRWLRGAGLLDLAADGSLLGLTLVSGTVPPSSEPDADGRALLAALRASFPAGRPITLELSSLSTRSGLSTARALAALATLEGAGALRRRRPRTGELARPTLTVPFDALPLDLSRLRAQEKRGLGQLRKMVDYAYHPRCRRAFLLRYFGELDAAGPCGRCDVCA